MEGAKGARRMDAFSFKVIDSAIDALRNAVRYRMPRRKCVCVNWQRLSAIAITIHPV